MENHSFSLDEARQLDIVEYLEKLGHKPQKIRDNDYWYLSPLRNEKEPSFKVHRKLNVWYDHGLGQGGNMIDLGILYHKCSFKEVMEKLYEIFSFHKPTPTVQQHYSSTQIRDDNALEPAIKVIAAKPLTHLALCRYLETRKIPFEIAEKYCKEVYYELYGKKYFAIGFKNNAGGYELRNAYFKGSTSPKDITTFELLQAKEVAVFEGFFSFLSSQTIHEKNVSLTNFLVLNSLSFFEKSRSIMENYQAINLYLDRDSAGIKNTLRALDWDKKYIDQSHLYKNHKDLNDYLVQESMRQKQGYRFKNHL
jgi:CHC2 zinc finger/Toprim-like